MQWLAKDVEPQRAKRTRRKDLKAGWFAMVDSVICLPDNLTDPIHFYFSTALAPQFTLHGVLDSNLFEPVIETFC